MPVLGFETGMHPIWNHKTKWNLGPKQATLRGHFLHPRSDVYSFWVRKPRVNSQDCTQLQRHGVIKCTHDQLMLHFCDVHGVTQACSAPGAWIQGWATTAASCSLVPKRPVSLVMRFLAHDLDCRMAVTSKSPGAKDNSWQNSCGKQVFVSHYCFDKIMIAFNPRPQIKGWMKEWKNPGFCTLVFNTWITM